MSKEAKIKAFKIVFKRRSDPSDAQKKLKGDLEDLVNSTAKKKGTAKDIAAAAVSGMGTRFAGEDPDFFVDTLSYKLAKHWDHPKQLEMWLAVATPANVVASLDQLMGDAPSGAFVGECWSRFGDTLGVTDLCFSRAPENMTGAYLAFFDEYNMVRPTESTALKSAAITEMFTQGKRDEIPVVIRKSLSVDEGRKLAKRDPQAFARLFIDEAPDPDAKFIFLADPEIRDLLSPHEDLWDELTGSVPMLSFLEKVETAVSASDLAGADLEAAKAGAVFDELLSTDSTIPITYYTNSLSSPVGLLAAPRKQMEDQATERKALSNDPTHPDMPAAQCDELVTVLTSAVKATLGPNATIDCKHVVIPGMVLTVPLSGLPGGLLKNSFGGNVYRGKKLTGQVLFTGDADADDPNSHTYLDVGGVFYDAVLGTRGTAVTQAVAHEFGAWNKESWKSRSAPHDPVWVTKAKNAELWIIKEAGLKAAANQNGFSTAYRLTENPGNYLDPND